MSWHKSYVKYYFFVIYKKDKEMLKDRIQKCELWKEQDRERNKVNKTKERNFVSFFLQYIWRRFIRYARYLTLLLPFYLPLNINSELLLQKEKNKQTPIWSSDTCLYFSTVEYPKNWTLYNCDPVTFKPHCRSKYF